MVVPTKPSDQTGTSQVCHKNRRYTSDLSDVAWQMLQPLLPLHPKRRGRPLKIDLREAVNGMLYLVKTGCQWQNLPREFPKWQSIYYHYRKWCRDGTWERINRALVYHARQHMKRDPHPSAAIIDSQSVKTTEVGDHAVMIPAKRSKAVSAISWSIPSATCGKWSFIQPISRTVMEPGCYLPLYPRCYAYVCLRSGPMAAIEAL